MKKATYEDWFLQTLFATIILKHNYITILLIQKKDVSVAFLLLNGLQLYKKKSFAALGRVSSVPIVEKGIYWNKLKRLILNVKYDVL